MSHKPLDESTAKVGDVVYTRYIDEQHFLEGKIVFISDKPDDYEKYLFVYETKDNRKFSSFWLQKEEVFTKTKTKKIYFAVTKDVDSDKCHGITRGYESQDELLKCFLSSNCPNNWIIKEIEIEV